MRRKRERSLPTKLVVRLLIFPTLGAVLVLGTMIARHDDPAPPPTQHITHVQP